MEFRRVLFRSVVIAVIAVGEKDMPAHLARQRAAGFLHLRLDQAVAGLPHQRLAAELDDAVEQRLARLHVGDHRRAGHVLRSEEHTSELQSLMRISYAVFCLKKKNKNSILHVYQPQYTDDKS